MFSWTFAPLWLPAAIGLTLAIVSCVIALLSLVIDEWKRK